MGHLTNFSLNKQSSKFKVEEDFKENDSGNKRMFDTVIQSIQETYNIDPLYIKSQIKDLMTKISLIMKPTLIHKYHSAMGR